MDTHTNYAKDRTDVSAVELLDGLAYLQSRVGVNFTITFLKTTSEWQFAIPTNVKVGTKIRNRSFLTLISCAEKYMAEVFKDKYGRDYMDTFTQERQIAELENSVAQLTKENLRLGKLILKKEEDEGDKSLDKWIPMEIGNPNIPCEAEDDSAYHSPKEDTSPKLVFTKEGKRARVKRLAHKEMLKRFRSITIHNPDNLDEYIVIKSVEDIDKWKLLDPSDYKREYTNARQRLYWATQQKKKGKKVKSSKKKNEVVKVRKYGITDEGILAEMRRDYDNPWKAHKTKKWKKAFKRATMRLYANAKNLNNKKLQTQTQTSLPW